MRIRFALIPVALLLRAFIAPADAAPSAELVLSGSRTASVVVTLGSPAHLDNYKARFSGTSAFLGFYAERIDVPLDRRWQPSMQTGMVRIRDLHGPNDTGWTLDLRHGTDDTLTPGRWRLYLLTDGPGQVRVPWAGAPSMRLVPRAPAYAAVVARTDILTSPIAGSNRQPLVIRGSRNLTVASVGFGNFRVFAGSMAACVAVPEGECGSASRSGLDQGWGPALMESPLRDMAMQFTIAYEPGMIKPGRYESLQDVKNATTLQFATGAAFTLELL